MTRVLCFWGGRIRDGHSPLPPHTQSAAGAGQEPVDFTAKTAIGSLGHYVSEYVGDDFQPMNVTFGIMESIPERIRKKALRYAKVAERALEIVKEIAPTL